MGFWSGFEGLTGHRPGAFKGFSFKDILDKDLWERRERKFPSPRYAEEGLDAPTTAWYKGMGRPEMMGPRVGAAATGPTYQDRFDATTLANQRRRDALWGSGPSVAHTRAARPRANIKAQMLGDPRQGPHPSQFGSPTPAFVSPATGMLQGVGRDRPFPIARRADIASQAEQDRLRAINSGNPAALRAAGITPAMGVINREPKWLDKTTTTKSSAAIDVPDVTTTVIKEKVPAVQPTAHFAQDIIDYTPPTEAELFGPPDAASFTGSAQWGNSRHPPNWLQRMDEGYFGRPRSEQAANWQPDAGAKAKPMWGLIDWYRDLARRRHEEAMRARRGY